MAPTWLRQGPEEAGSLPGESPLEKVGRVLRTPRRPLCDQPAALRPGRRQPERRKGALAPADPKAGGGEGSRGEGW